MAARKSESAPLLLSRGFLAAPWGRPFFVRHPYGRRRAIRFYSYAQKKSVDIFVLPGPIGSPQDLGVSPDRLQMVYHQLSGLGTDLSIIEFE